VYIPFSHRFTTPARNLTVRREKHATVCSNAGESNWTAVKDYESRANQTFRKLQKQLDQDVNDNLEDIMQNEEDKVFAVQAFIHTFNFRP
jgi:ABC-type transporter Mla subunit MlaD